MYNAQALASDAGCSLDLCSPKVAAPHARAVFISSEAYRRKGFGNIHPLSIPRHCGVLDLCSQLGWLPASQIKRCSAASDEELERFHQPEYIRALRNAVEQGKVSLDTRQRYHFGTMENPLFSGLFERAAATVGGSTLAAQLALEGRLAFHPAGGTHHGRPDRAAGFCYFNDPVFAILTLLDASLERVLYVDLDAHHGDGVQDAFTDDPRVMTISIHEENRWPYSGAVTDRGGGNARNLCVPAGFNDSELDFLMHAAVLPLLQSFNPKAIVITCGADGLKGDPLSRMEISNGALWSAVEKLVSHSAHTVVLGGGGYNPWTVVRCWTGLWGKLSGRSLPATLPVKAQQLLGSYECDLLDEEDLDPDWICTLEDPPNNGVIREAVKTVAKQVVNNETA